MSYDFSGFLRKWEKYPPRITQEEKTEEFLRFFDDRVSERIGKVRRG
jgi:hypothetical protein